MKNAFVLEHHLGDNGTVTEGMILKGIDEKRFKTLEARGLVREATADEVKKGYKAPFVASNISTADENEPGSEKGGVKKAPDPENKAAPAASSK